MSTSDMQGAKQQFDAMLSALQHVPFQTVESALESQLKMLDDWERRVRDQPALMAMAGVVRAQLQASQRMMDVARRESEQVAQAISRVAETIGPPTPGS